jgi:porin
MKREWKAPRVTFTVMIALVACVRADVLVAEPAVEDAALEGMVAIADYSGSWVGRSHLTGDWGGVRQQWADKGVTFGFDWYQAYQAVVDGGIAETGESSGNLDYRAALDLMRMDLVPGALISLRAQSRFGDTVNARTGQLLPVNMYSAFPLHDGDVDIAVTELNLTQFLSDKFAVLVGKITTLATANEFMGGEGRSQFMNYQLNFSAALAQLAPYSTLAVGGIWLPNGNVTVTTILMNYQDSSTTSGFDDFGEGVTWATTADYLCSPADRPGGGTLAFYYGFDTTFAHIGAFNIDPNSELVLTDTDSDAWAVSWSGWQYLHVEEGLRSVDPRNGRQDLQGVGVFAQVALADEDTNPITWSCTAGLSGRGSIPRRDHDTWGIGYFWNDLQDLDRETLDFSGTASGVEVYYDIALAGSTSLTLDAQWAKSAFPSVDDATILAARMNMRF